MKSLGVFFVNRVIRQIGCDYAIDKGISGKGVGVGVLDSGVFLHPDIKDRIFAFQDFVYGKKYAYDDSGHGTFVSGVIAGNGNLSDGQYRGIAPDAELYVGKVLYQDGDGNYEKLIAGIEWLLSNKEKFHLKIINISAASKKDKKKGANKKEEKLRKLFQKANEMGIVVVVAAGNFGPKEGSLSIIGEGKYTISVGCHDGNYKFPNTKMCEEYSGRGPSEYYLKKPDIVAPGTAIVSCGLDGYCTKSGTSMATPLVSGALALAYERFPNKSANEIVKKLQYSARDLGEPWNKQGFGMLDIKRLLTP